MNIQLTNVGKRFNAEWIFRHVNFEFGTQQRYAITGPNGSGKSTLLQVVGSFIHHNEGNIRCEHDGRLIPAEKLHSHVSMAAPYLEVIEEMTLKEFFSFHRQMKGLLPSASISEIAAAVSLSHALHKQIRYFSSGMKQRVKLAQAFFSPTPILLLDEPLTNLDKAGFDTYLHLIENFTRDRIVIISSNDEREFHFCEQRVDITDFKQNDNL